MFEEVGVHSGEAITAQLQHLGLRSGDLVMVHASLRAIGEVEERADGLIDALIEALGPSGTALMVLGADADEPFDAESTEVDVEDLGTLAEVFRLRAGPQVSDHAAARFAALGPLAPALLRDPPLHDYYGAGSTLERLVQHRGSVLRLGADVDTVTLTHHAEYLANVPKKRRARLRYVRADIGEQWIEGLDDLDGIREWDHGDYFSQILLDFVGAGGARTGPVGDCTGELFEAQAFVDFAVHWMEAHLAG